MIPDENSSDRNWRLIVTFLLFCLLYSLLHKLLVPFFLKFTTVNKTPYSHIDWWFLHSIALYWVFIKSGKPTKLAAFFSGTGILYGVYQTYEVWMGHLVGWLAFSKLLSSIPTAIVCGVVMCLPSFRPFLSQAWLGAFALFTLIGLSHVF